MPNCKIAVWIFSVTCMWATLSQSACIGSGRNLISNSSFECGSAGWQSYLLGSGGFPEGLFKLHGRVEKFDDAPHGRMVLSLGMNAPPLLWSYLQRMGSINLIAAPVEFIKLKAGETYTLSAFLRSDTGNATIRMMVCYSDGLSQTYQANATDSWRRISFTFKALGENAIVGVGVGGLQHLGDRSFLDALQLESGNLAGAYELRSQIEFFIVSDSPGNVWVGKEEGSLYLIGYNDGDEAELDIDVQINDFREEVVLHRRNSIRALRAAQFIIPLSDAIPKKFGFYRATAELTDKLGNAIGVASARCARIPRYDGVDSPFGIEWFHPCGELMLLSKRAGLLWQRVLINGISDVISAQVDSVLKFGMHVLISMAVDAQPQKINDKVQAATAFLSKDEDEFIRRVESVIKSYRTRAVAFEVFSDELRQMSLMNLEFGSGDLKGRIELLKAAYSAAKRACKDCLFLWGMWVGDNELMDKQVGEFIRAGSLKFVDALGVGVDLTSVTPERFERGMKSVMAKMDACGMRKPIWVTRCELALDDSPKGLASHYAADDGELYYSACLVRFAAIVFSHGVTHIFYSPAHASKWTSSYGLLFKADGTPTKILPTQAALANLLTSRMHYIGSIDFGDNARCYAFRTAKGAVAIAWLIDEDAAVSISLGRSVKAYDLMGNEIGCQKVRLTFVPIYLTSQFGDLRSIASSVRLISEKED